jgi:phage internal scaffolding protein
MKFRTAYAPQMRSVVDFTDSEGNFIPGRTEQCHKKDCDIDVILRKYDKTGLVTHVNRATAEYGDYTEINEYQEALNMVIRAQDAFDELPSKVRKKFNHDPGAFFEYATDPSNYDGMVELGLANPKPVEAPLEPKMKAPVEPKTDAKSAS